MPQDRRLAAALFTLTFVTCGYFFGGGGWNQNAYFDLTRALVERRTLWIDGYHGNTGDVVVAGRHVYANKAPGLAFLAAVPYAILYPIERAARLDPGSARLLTINAYLCTLLSCGIAGALIAPVLFLYARRRLGISPLWSASIALIIALATPLLAYSTLLFIHVPSALLTILSFTWSSDERGNARAGVVAGLNALTNYVAIPLLAIFAIRVAWRREAPFRRLLQFVAGAAPALLILAWYQQRAFGAIFRNPATMNPAFTDAAGGGVLRLPSFEALLGITISSYRGLFWISPVLLFAIAGLIVMFRRRLWSDAMTICGVVAVFVGFNTSFNNWDGGSAFAPRYILPIVPLLGIAVLHVAGWWKPLFLILATISVANSVAAAAVDPQVPITVANPLFDYIYPLLFWGSLAPVVVVQPPWLAAFLTGHTSVNRQAIDEILPMVRHAPGSSAAEWASFNLGELVFGPGSAASLVPILLWLIGASAFLIAVAWRGAATQPDAETG